MGACRRCFARVPRRPAHRSRLRFQRGQAQDKGPDEPPPTGSALGTALGIAHSSRGRTGQRLTGRTPPLSRRRTMPRAQSCKRQGDEALESQKDDSERHTGAIGPLQSSCRARTVAYRASPPNGRRARRKYYKQAMAAPRSRLPTIRLPESRDPRPNSPDASHQMHQLDAMSTSAQRHASSLGHTARAGGILRAADTSIGGSPFAPASISCLSHGVMPSRQ